ncbi:16S rRNA (cytosine(1402)-N(4))-methyltransferase RsmH [Pedobacter deserti]|uniref:16S rRNA (cytosine(1402)-N(4))-methyltransferase RsmH n=1 Tax=Pedobacter deserti TaxID=2817382 RepID=UPI00210B7DF1|nr:16S rRNA (cytosine(1402)-N(4))-methyltransferase RsmH [Pedobacter sp. SYSU D00382]
MEYSYHTPVLLKEAVEGLAIKPDGVYVDVTFGGGGHSREILKALGDKGVLVAFDQDPDAQRNIIKDSRFKFVDQNFAFLKNNLRLLGIAKVDGILADLGVSSHQFNEADRGFSTRYDAELNMRMDKQGDLTAASILNTYAEDLLHKIFGVYGEIKNARSLAKAVVTARLERPITTLSDFKSLASGLIPRGRENKYLAQVFQALRIEVNQEMHVLEQFLLQSAEILKPGGRLVVISYHSLEDRPVKNFLSKGKFKGEVDKDFYGNQQKPFEVITRKAVVAGADELAKNSRARSAKLRIGGRL